MTAEQWGQMMEAAANALESGNSPETVYQVMSDMLTSWGM